MDVNNLSEIKDGDPTRSLVLIEAPSILSLSKPKSDGNIKKKRRRGKTKRNNIMKPYLKIAWQERRKNEARNNSKRNKRFRKIVLAKTQAPFNNNQFLMEIHKPEPENNIFRTPSARTRDSSFSVDSEDNNYFFSLPEDEEEYLTKEFSSVYEDAQCERLSNMSKNELIEEYLLLEAKYDTLVKRAERFRSKENEEDKSEFDSDNGTLSEKDNLLPEKDPSVTSFLTEEQPVSEILLRLKEQEEQIRELQSANEKLRLENEHLQQQNQSMSEDSESDSSSSSDSCSTSSCNSSPVHEPDVVINNEEPSVPVNGVQDNTVVVENGHPIVNGFHNPTE